jgi:spermidine synthase
MKELKIKSAPAKASLPRPVQPAWLRFSIYACFFLSGAASIVFEILWSRQFVTVFGNSAYAASIVLCAYMAGLGFGGWIGGRLADQIQRRMIAFGTIQFVVGIWAWAVPFLVEWLRVLVPSMAASIFTRFGLSFAVMVVPCFLMGTTLPLLTRAVTESAQSAGARIGALYSWNTLGAALGCLAAGFWMLDTFGMRKTNFAAIGMEVLAGVAALGLSRHFRASTEPVPVPIAKKVKPELHGASGSLLLTVAFVNGLASLACEVLWFRYLAFVILDRPAYVFPTILGVYLLGLGLGAWIYSALTHKIRCLTQALAFVETLLAISVLVTFSAGALIFAAGPPRPMEMIGMAMTTVLLPAVLMGVSFPLLCNIYGSEAQTLGRSVGLLFAVNTAGAVLGSLLPVFVLVPAMGIQKSLWLASLLYGAMGLALLARGKGAGRWLPVSIYGIAIILFLTIVPSDLCQRVFLATGYNLARHTDILFYREGRTGTAFITRDQINQTKAVYINANPEVPVLYGDQFCFKMLGDLGPMLHPKPDNVLMICLGGGLAAGATATLPDVQSLTVVDLESSVAEAAAQLSEENNHVLQNPKTHLIIDDGRNFIMTAHRRWPVIVSDSTHPKTPDSWVLYTREFYQLVREHLTDDGIFVEWVPMHGLGLDEYKIILRTFQSVFPHASLWVTDGVEEQGHVAMYSLLVATPGPLNIDVAQLQKRLAAAPVQSDLAPYGMNSIAGLLDSFVCSENAFRQCTGDGPINTDDLPYTYYVTPHSAGEGADWSGFFIEPMEDIWPYVTNAGTADAAQLLRDDLALRAKANRLAFAGRADEGYALLPDDVRYRTMRRLFGDGVNYNEALAKVFWNDPQGLAYFASLRGERDIKSIYERVLALDPNNASALAILGGMHTDAGEFAPAEDFLRRAVRLDPKSTAAQYNLAVLLDKSDRHPEALEHYRQAALNTTDPMPLDVWGVCLAQQGRKDEAREWFQRAVDLRPTEIPPRLHLIYSLEEAGCIDKALPHARFLVKMDPENKTFTDLLAELETRRNANAFSH